MDRPGFELGQKKIDTELSLYFPGEFEDATIKEYYDQLRSHTLLKLKHIITGTDVHLACKEIEIRLALLIRPRLFSGAKSAEICYDKEFEEMCLILTQNLQVQPQRMTVLQFYNAFEYLKKEAKKRKAQNKRKWRHFVACLIIYTFREIKTIVSKIRYK